MDMEDRDIPSQMPPQPASVSTPCTLPLSSDTASADTQLIGGVLLAASLVAQVQSTRHDSAGRLIARGHSATEAEARRGDGGRPSATEAHRSDGGRPNATEARRAGARAGGASADEGEAGDARRWR
jgi:hypothetical protein